MATEGKIDPMHQFMIEPLFGQELVVGRAPPRAARLASSGHGQSTTSAERIIWMARSRRIVRGDGEC